MRRSSCPSALRGVAALLPLSLLLLSVLLFVSPSFNPSSSLLLPVVAARSSPSITASVNAAYIGLFRETLLAYQLLVPSFSVTLSTNSGASGRVAASSGLFDFTIASNGVSNAMRVTNPGLEAYPIATSGIAPLYNLPTAVVGSATLELTNQAMCRIIRGDITHWNDTAIASRNPSLKLPGERIIVAHLVFINDLNVGLSLLCNKVDAGWAATIGVSNNPALPHAVVITSQQNAAGVASFVLDHPYSIGVTPRMAVRTQVAQLINQAGKTVSSSPATVAQAFLELAANGPLPDGNGFDLSNAQSAYAWPMSMGAWLLIDRDAVQSTCATKGEVLKFLLWMYESPVALSLAESASISLPPALYLKQSGLLDQMRREILCDGASLVQADSTSASVRGNDMITSSVNLMMQLFSQVDSTYSYSFRSMPDALALDRIAVGEIDFASQSQSPHASSRAISDAAPRTMGTAVHVVVRFVSPSVLSDDQVSLFREPTFDPESGALVPGGMVLPAFLVGVVPTFSLPTPITALYAKRSAADDLGLPELYPLVIDLEALAEIFLGTIRTWTHERMQQLNPRLKAWFERTGAPTALRSVVCCTDETDPFVAGHILAQHLLSTRAMNVSLGAAGVAAARRSPKSMWKAVQALHALPSAMSLVDREVTTPPKLLMQPGSVSYRVFSTARPNAATDFQLRVTNMLGASEDVPASPDNVMACVAPFVAYPEFVNNFLATGVSRDSSNIAPGCWPLQSLASLAVGSAFSSKNEVASDGAAVVAASGGAASSHQSACVRAQKNLELLRWMQLNPVLSGALRNNGVVRLSDLPQVRSFILDQRLNTATCDGKTILITLPLVWSVPTSATAFAIAIAAVIATACAATIGGLYHYRHHPAIRGASPIFLAQVAVGLALLAGSLVAWASPVTESSCLTFQWLVDLGFTLAFAPLFAKTWRIYQIFSAKKIKVVKITNGRLVWAVLAMLAFELVVLSAWTGVSPLQPVLFEQATNQQDGAILQLTHCAVEGAAGTAFLAIEAAFKGALLLFGCLMAFSTRKVTASFNESQTIAWAIYNVVFSSLVVGAILLFLDTQGDTLIWLVLILFLWTAVGTWALIFVPKASAVFGGEDRLQHTANSISLGSLSKNDGSITFASITGMGRSQLLAYRSALESQLDKVRRALGLAAGRADSEGKVLQPRSGGALEQPDTNFTPNAAASMRAAPSSSRPAAHAHASRRIAPGIGLKSAAEQPAGPQRAGSAISPAQQSRALDDQALSPMATFEAQSSPSSTTTGWVPSEAAGAQSHWALDEVKSTAAAASAGSSNRSSGSGPISIPFAASAADSSSVASPPSRPLSIDPSASASAAALPVDLAPASPVRVAVSLAPKPSSRAQAAMDAV